MPRSRPGFWRRLFTKAVRIPPLTMIVSPQHHAKRKWKYEQFVEEAYEGNPFVKRGVGLIAGGLGSLEWYLERRRVGSDDVEQIYDHPILRLMERPHPYFGGASFMYTIGLNLLLGGKSFLIKAGPENMSKEKRKQCRPLTGNPTTDARAEKAARADAPPKELHIVPPNTVDLVPGDAVTPISAFSYTPAPGKRKETYDPRDVVYIRIPSALDPLDGFPPIAAAAMAVDRINAAELWNYNLLKNDARPMGAFTVGEVLEETDRVEVERRMNDRIAGFGNAGRIPVMAGDAKFDPWSLSPADMMWDQLIQIGAREVALALDIPPKLMFDAESQNYASLREAKRQLWTEANLPLADLVTSELNNQLVPDWEAGGETLTLKYNRDAIEELSEDRDSLWKRVNEAQGLAVNEKRRELGYPDIEGGDVILVDSNKLPLEAMGTDGPNAEE